MIFFSWCLTHLRVDDCGHPVRLWRQFQHTDDNRVNDRLSELVDLPGVNSRRSSSCSKSLAYSIKNARINTASSISSGKSLNFYSTTPTHRVDVGCSVQVCTFLSFIIMSWLFVFCYRCSTTFIFLCKIANHSFRLHCLWNELPNSCCQPHPDRLISDIVKLRMHFKVKQFC